VAFFGVNEESHYSLEVFFFSFFWTGRLLFVILLFFFFFLTIQMLVFQSSSNFGFPNVSVLQQLFFVVHQLHSRFSGEFEIGTFYNCIDWARFLAESYTTQKPKTFSQQLLLVVVVFFLLLPQ
jgi:hypothetical protein